MPHYISLLVLNRVVHLLFAGQIYLQLYNPAHLTLNTRSQYLFSLEEASYLVSYLLQLRIKEQLSPVYLETAVTVSGQVTA